MAKSILERYNKIVKRDLGKKRTCNSIIFLKFINSEINRINIELVENQNINALYNMKATKFGIEKYAISDSNAKLNNNDSDRVIEIDKDNINNKWLIQKGNN